MWSVDPEGDYRFSDATDQNQVILFNEDPIPQLLERILKQHNDRPRVVVKEIIEWVETETGFLKTHLKKALTKGEVSGSFVVLPVKDNGAQRHGRSFAPDVVVDFSREGTKRGEQGSLFS